MTEDRSLTGMDALIILLRQVESDRDNLLMALNEINVTNDFAKIKAICAETRRKLCFGL